MIRGFYTAASGLVTQQQRLNAYADNIANVSTPGYKKDNLIPGSFGEHMAVRMNAYQEAGGSQLGGGLLMQTVESKYTDHSQGGFLQTNRTLDFAIQGEGYFVIEGYDGGEYLTRDGQFALDEEGYLVLPGLGRVQGDDGDIQLDTSEFGVERDGTIITWDEEDEVEEVTRLSVAVPEDYTALEKTASGLFAAGNYTLLEEERGETGVIQRALERSNVDMSEEMTRMIASQRSLQSCSQLVKIYDELAEQITNRVSKV